MAPWTTTRKERSPTRTSRRSFPVGGVATTLETDPDTKDADGTDGDATDGTDGDSSDADGTDGTDSDGTDGTDSDGTDGDSSATA